MSTDLIVKPEEALASRSAALAPDLAAMFERVLTDASVDVSKLEALIGLNERVMDRAAKAAFDDAFSRMWPELPEITERGTIRNKDGSTKSRYAKYEDIQEAVRPVLAKFGFAMRHRAEFPENKGNVIRIVGILSGHGHTEESVFEAPPDKNDYRTAIQDQGSTVSYGKRYTTCDLLNIITRGQDNDGQPEKAKAPEGFDKAWAALEGIATAGLRELEDAWGKIPNPIKEFVLNHRKAEWAALKASAAKVKR